MKFLLIVLAIHFVVELIAGRKKAEEIARGDNSQEKIFHPAEYGLR